MKSSETAIVFIEFQNDFCKEGGALYEGVKGQIKAQNTIINAQDCIKKARGKCLTLIVPILFEQDYCDAGCEGVLGPIHGNVIKTKAFRKGTWGGAIVDELIPQSKISWWRASEPWMLFIQPTSTFFSGSIASRTWRSAAS
jgi:nicotinamidase-related amidase